MNQTQVHRLARPTDKAPDVKKPSPAESFNGIPLGDMTITLGGKTHPLMCSHGPFLVSKWTPAEAAPPTGKIVGGSRWGLPKPQRAYLVDGRRGSNVAVSAGGATTYVRVVFKELSRDFVEENRRSRRGGRS
jgi:hypothetical protein